jgi:hypothetical protein
MKIEPSNFKSYATFVLTLVGLGLIAAWLIHRTFVALGVNDLWWLETPGAIGVAGMLFSLYDKYLWRQPIFAYLGLVDQPDIQGRWKGETTSSHDKKNSTAYLEIRQTATSLAINLYTERSHSKSMDASFVKLSEGVFCLRYSYENHPETFVIETMQTHLGLATVTYFSDIKQLRGDYFTSRERKTHGTMRFKLVSRKLLGRFK